MGNLRKEAFCQPLLTFFFISAGPFCFLAVCYFFLYRLLELVGWEWAFTIINGSDDCPDSVMGDRSMAFFGVTEGV